MKPSFFVLYFMAVLLLIPAASEGAGICTRIFAGLTKNAEIREQNLIRARQRIEGSSAQGKFYALLILLRDSPKLSRSEQRLLDHFIPEAIVNSYEGLSRFDARDRLAKFQILDFLGGAAAWAFTAPVFRSLYYVPKVRRRRAAFGRFLSKIESGFFDEELRKFGIERGSDDFGAIVLEGLRVKAQIGRVAELPLQAAIPIFVGSVSAVMGLNPVSELSARIDFGAYQQVQEVDSVAVRQSEVLDSIEAQLGEFERRPVFVYLDGAFRRETLEKVPEFAEELAGLDNLHVLDADITSRYRENPRVEFFEFNSVEDLSEQLTEMPQTEEPPIVILKFHGTAARRASVGRIERGLPAFGSELVANQIDEIQTRALPENSTLIFLSCSFGAKNCSFQTPQDENWIRFASQLAGGKNITAYAADSTIMYPRSVSIGALSEAIGSLRSMLEFAGESIELLEVILKDPKYRTELSESQVSDFEQRLSWLREETEEIRHASEKMGDGQYSQSLTSVLLIRLSDSILERRELHDQISQALPQFTELQRQKTLSEGLEELTDALDEFTEPRLQSFRNRRFPRLLWGGSLLNAATWPYFEATTPEFTGIPLLRSYNTQTGEVTESPLPATTR